MAILKFDDVPWEQVREGLRRKIIHTSRLMTVLLEFSDGPWEEPEPPHSHPHDQTSYVAEGEIIFICEDEADQHLKAGDMFAIAGGKRHTIRLLSREARLIDSFHPLREEFLNQPNK